MEHGYSDCAFNFVAATAQIDLETHVDLVAMPVQNEVIELQLDEDADLILANNVTVVNSFQIRNRKVSPVKKVLAQVIKL